MILLICKTGTEHIKDGQHSLASIAQYSFDYKPMEYGFTYNAFSKSPPPPKIQLDENVFVISRNVIFDEISEEELIGDFRESSIFIVNAKRLFNNIRSLLPPGYTGNFCFNACLESSRSTHGFATSFNLLLQRSFRNSRALGRKSGTITAKFDGGSYPIIPPCSDYQTT